MRGWQANERHTCVLPVVLGLCPKLKYPLLCRGIIIGIAGYRIRSLSIISSDFRQFSYAVVPSLDESVDILIRRDR